MRSEDRTEHDDHRSAHLSQGTTAQSRRRPLIRADATYSLREAAGLLDIPEGTLRRAILLDDLPAEGVCDDRHYLIEGHDLLAHFRLLRPDEESNGVSSPSIVGGAAFLALFPILAAILLLLAGMRSPKGDNRPQVDPIPAIEVQVPDR